MRGIPIFTFVNKLDRYGRAPLELMDEVEQVLGIRAYPMNWPIGMGPEFRGVYDRAARGGARLLRRKGRTARPRSASAASRSTRRRSLELLEPSASWRKLQRGDRAARRGGDAFDREKVRPGQHHAGVLRQRDDQLRRRPFLDAFLELAPPPGAAPDRQGLHRADRPRVLAASSSRSRRTWIPPHRDRIAFVRVFSGRFVKGMTRAPRAPGQGGAPRQARASSWPPSGRRSRRPGRATSSACSTRACSASATRCARASTLRVRGHPALLARALRRRAREGPAAAQAAGEGPRAALRGGRHPDLPAAADGHAATRSSARSARCSSR